VIKLATLIRTKNNLKTIGKTPATKAWLYLVLLLLLIGCLWVGWHDFDPRIAQEVVRENIRSLIRRTIQIVIQCIIPLGILIFFAREIIANKCSKQ